MDYRLTRLVTLLLIFVPSICFGGLPLTNSTLLDYPGISAIAIDGAAVTITADESVTLSGYTAGDLTFTCTTAGTVTVSGVTGSGTSYSGTASATVANGDTCTAAYDGDAYWYDADSLDLAGFSGQAVTVNTAAAATADFDLDFNQTPSGSTYTTGGGEIPDAISGTLVGTAAVSTTQPSDGLQSLDILANGDHMLFVVTADDLIDDQIGYIKMTVIKPAAGEIGLFEVNNTGGDNNNRMYASIDSNGYVYFRHVGNGSSVSMTTTTAPPTTEVVIELVYDVAGSLNAGANMAIRVAGGSWEYEVDADTMTAFANPQNELAIGDYRSVAGATAVYIGGFEVTKSIPAGLGL